MSIEESPTPRVALKLDFTLLFMFSTFISIELFSVILVNIY